MTNREAIEIFNKWMDCKDAYQADPSCDGNCLSCEYYTSAEGEKEAMLLAVAALEKQEQDRWIPCSVRLPVEKDAGILKKLGTDKRSDYVLATVEAKGERMTVTACTYDGKWSWNMKYAFPDYKVIAWMPLPAPYQEEEA